MGLVLHKVSMVVESLDTRLASVREILEERNRERVLSGFALTNKIYMMKQE